MEMTREMFRVLISSCSAPGEREDDDNPRSNAVGTARTTPLGNSQQASGPCQRRTYAVRRRPLPASLMASLKVCWSCHKPPAKKHRPRQSSMVAKIEPRIAALMTSNMSFDRSTMNRTISTMEPNLTWSVVSR